MQKTATERQKCNTCGQAIALEASLGSEDRTPPCATSLTASRVGLGTDGLGVIASLLLHCLENPTDRGAWGGCKESDTTEANECTQCCYNDIMGHVFLHSVLEIRQLFYRKGK